MTAAGRSPDNYLDFFHDLADSVTQSAEANSEKLKLKWAQDSAFHFFPVQTDKFCGYQFAAR